VGARKAAGAYAMIQSTKNLRGLSNLRNRAEVGVITPAVHTINMRLI
jgi:hypothetical protein